MKKIYTVYENEIASAEVVPWGKGYKAVANNTGLAFQCRCRFHVGQYAESEVEAWERFRQQANDRIVSCHEKIRASLTQVKLADEKIAALKA